MKVSELLAAFIVGGFFYFILSVLTCALHVRFAPYSQISRMFRRRPFLAALYPFAILLFCVKRAIVFIHAAGHEAYINLFEFISGRKIYQKAEGYSDFSHTRRATVDRSANHLEAEAGTSLIGDSGTLSEKV